MTIQNLYPGSRPTLNLHFAKVKALDPRITFTRASSARYYDGKTVAKSEENLLIRSQEFNDGVWGKARVTVLVNSTTAPDGTTTASTLTEIAETNSHALSQVHSGGVVSGLTYTYSAFLKKGTSATAPDWVQLAADNVFGGEGFANFNLTTGLAGNQSGFTGSISSVGNGWYRCSITGTATSSLSNNRFFIVLVNNQNTSSRTPSYAGSITSDVLIWGAQVEQRSSVTAYTATTTAPITNYVPVLLSAANNVARFDHNPVTGESLGLLIEEQRTNLLQRSEEFDNASWTKSATATITANQIVAPDGTVTGDLLTASQGDGVYQTITVVSGTAVTSSYYVKGGTAATIMLRDDTGAGRHIVVSTSTWTITSSSGTLLGSGVTAVGNGWYRLYISYTTDTTGARGFIRPDNSGAGQTFYIWGAQLEAGAFPTSYIPTVASQVTRSADAASITGTNFTSWFNNAEGTIYGAYTNNVVIPTANFGGLFELREAANSRIILLQNPGELSNAGLYVQVSGTVVANMPLPLANQTLGKIAGAYKVNDFAVVINQGTVNTNTSGNLPVPTLANIGSNGGSVKGSFTISKLAYYPKRLTNDQLQALTT